MAAERELLRPEHELSPEESLFRSARDALLVRALCAQGRFPEARKLTERDEMPGELTWAVVLWKTGRGKILTSAGEHADAERFARDAVEIAARVQSPNSHGGALMDLADVLARGDRAQEAVLVATEARALYERKSDVVPAAGPGVHRGPRWSWNSKGDASARESPRRPPTPNDPDVGGAAAGWTAGARGYGRTPVDQS